MCVAGIASLNMEVFLQPTLGKHVFCNIMKVSFDRIKRVGSVAGGRPTAGEDLSSAAKEATQLGSR